MNMALKIMTWLFAGLAAVAIVVGATNLANARVVTGECVATFNQLKREITATYGNVEKVSTSDKNEIERVVKAFPEMAGIVFETMPEAVTVFGIIPMNDLKVVLLVFHNGNCVVETGYAMAVDFLAFLRGSINPDDLNI